MKTIRIICICLIALFVCVKISAQHDKTAIIFIGNSITEANYLDNKPPSIAAKYLESHGYQINFANCGVSGSTTYDFLPSARKLFPRVTEATDRLIEEGNKRLLFSLMLGTNDSAITGPTGAPVSPDKYRENLQIIIDDLTNRYPQAVFVLHRPLWYSPTTHNRARYLQEGLDRINLYPDELDKLIENNPGKVFKGDWQGYDFFRINFLTHHRPEEGNSGVFYLHPNAAGAEKLGELWGSALLKVIDHLKGNGK